jgi:hypothetical protein
VPGNQDLSCFGPGFIVPFCCTVFNKVNVVVVLLPSSAKATVKVDILMNNNPTV